MSVQLAPVEQSLVAYLREVTGKRFSTRVPADRPDEFGVIARAGGSRRNLVQSDVMIQAQIWGSESVNPWPLTKVAWEALARADEVELPHGLVVMRLNLTEPVNYPDEATGTPRYVFVFQPTVNI